MNHENGIISCHQLNIRLLWIFPPPFPLPASCRQYSNLNPTQTGWNLKPLLIGCLLTLHSSGGNMSRGAACHWMFEIQIWILLQWRAVDAKYERGSHFNRILREQYVLLAYIYAVSISVQTEVCDAISGVCLCVDGVRGGVWLGSISH